MVCKRRAPFPLSNSSWIDSDGLWGPKRTVSSMNNWNPSILLSTHSNHDIKLITNGEETKDISFYISMYATKKQHQSSNASALLAKAYAFHTSHERTTTDLALLNKRLIQRCANSLCREQEFSAPEIVSYLNGWDDRYISHRFENIHLASIMAFLKRTYPSLVLKR
ncbi:hypothetical protein M405DRAFT_851813 [Rhizopogon salebrosus TDB-379]|nr:hypothetical protein M405DRAFT_851813 [Rhizopogon salebrosus TDB-379]